jgi:hypothetical protein
LILLSDSKRGFHGCKSSRNRGIAFGFFSGDSGDDLRPRKALLQGAVAPVHGFECLLCQPVSWRQDIQAFFMGFVLREG